jgi:hypothetical protein
MGGGGVKKTRVNYAAEPRRVWGTVCAPCWLRLGYGKEEPKGG